LQINESEILRLEKKLIKKHKSLFKKIKPRPVKIVGGSEIQGADAVANPKYI